MISYHQWNMSKSDVYHFQVQVVLKGMCLLHTQSFHWLCVGEHNLGAHIVKKVELQEGRRLDL